MTVVAIWASTPDPLFLWDREVYVSQPFTSRLARYSTLQMVSKLGLRLTTLETKVKKIE